MKTKNIKYFLIIIILFITTSISSQIIVMKTTYGNVKFNNDNWIGWHPVEVIIEHDLKLKTVTIFTEIKHKYKYSELKLFKDSYGNKIYYSTAIDVINNCEVKIEWNILNHSIIKIYTKDYIFKYIYEELEIKNF